MRTIKFRVWDVLQNAMDYDFIPNESNGDKYFVDIQDGKLSVGNIDEHGAYYELVLMQFTGLKDKNDVEIYEGDIVEYDNGVKARVVFSDGGFCGYDGYALSSDEAYMMLSPFDIPFQDDPEFTVEVIGNIYENKDLL